MSRPKYSIGHCLLTGLLAWTVLSIAATPTYAQEARQRFDIPAQAASDALNAFSRQSGLRLLFPFEAVAGKQTQALSGELTAEEALEKLLAGSDLTFEITSSSVVLIRAKSASKTGSNATPQPSLKLAQNDERSARDARAGHPAAGAPQSTSDSEAREEKQKDRMQPVDIGEIIVTGTHIRGVESAGSKVLVLDRNYIDASGYATVQDVLRTLPQNFSGGVNEIAGTTDPQAFNNSLGAAVNLRGLGAAATLVLINGRRTAPGGSVGAFVDVSNIPASAIERIEVLPDGASAIYGSDAIGGVVNIILRRDYDGAETRARFGTLDGDADEIQASQLFGGSWSSGNALIGYQYYNRDALALTDRTFSADTDQRRNGGDNFSSFLSNPGNILSPFTGQPEFAIPTGQDGTSLTTADLLPGIVNFQNGAEQTDLLPEQEMHSAFLSLSHDLGERLHLFTEGRYNERDATFSGGGFGTTLFVPASNPFFVDPFGFGFVLVDYSFLDDFGADVTRAESNSYSGTLGATLDLGTAWQLTVAGSYAEEKNKSDAPLIDFTALDQALADADPATAFNPFGDGSHTNPATLEAIRASVGSRAVTELWNANIQADGPLFGLPGGNAKLAVGADYRDERFDSDSITHEIGFPDSSRGRGRTVSAVFAELALPFIGKENTVPGAQRLDVSLAGRYEDYSDFGTTFNPKLGLQWMPVESLQFRGTWGTSFKAPRLTELNETGTQATNNAFLLFGAADPESPSGTSTILVVGGNNEDLQEETATTWTAGLDFIPTSAPGLKVSLTYYDIDYEDRVVRPGPLALNLILLEEDQWAEVITRNPSQAQVDAICNSPVFFGPPISCTFSPPAAIVDVRLRNIALTNLSGIDLTADQTLDTEYGLFTLGLNGSYTLNFETAPSETSPVVDVADTLFNPVALRLRGSVSWSRGGWGANASVNYTDGYDDRTSQPNRSIDQWMTVDLQLSYRTVAGEGWLDGLQIALNAVNVFDEAPPFANLPVGYDATNANPYGRLISLQATLGW